MAPSWILLLVLFWMVYRAVSGTPSKAPACSLLVLVATVAFLCRRARGAAMGSRNSSFIAQTLRAAMRGSALVCRMVPFLWLRLLLLSMAASPVYAIRDIPSDEKSDSFESNMKDASIFFTYIGLIYYLLPFASFNVTQDWKRVFYDCFTPFSLWLDSAHCICVLLVTLFLIKNMEDHFGDILSLFVGLITSFNAIYHYVTMKLMEVNQTPNNFQMTQAKAKSYVTAMVLVAIVFTALVILQLEKRWYLPEHSNPDGLLLKFMIYFLTLVACGCEVAQVGGGIAHRIGSNWDDDERPVFWVKMAAAACVLFSDGFDTVNHIKVNLYWQRDKFTKSVVIMSSCSTICAVVLIVGRGIGPRRWKKAADCVVSGAKAMKVHAKNMVMGFFKWVKDRRFSVSKACAEGFEREVAGFG